MHYVVQKSAEVPLMSTGWDDASWAGAETLEVTHFRPESSEHRPRTQARLLHDGRAIHGIFRVEDRYVRCVRANYFDEVWKDSCVEFFTRPRPDKGYFNFEFNCGGAFLCSYIVNPERAPGGFKEWTRVPAEQGQMIEAKASLPARVEPEITVPTTWTLRFRIPLELMENYTGPLGQLSGQTWRGNFFKCAEEVSHPHWASWSPVDEFNFHRPQCFGELRFG